MSKVINYNGKLFNASDPVISTGNRGYRYGDGFFETIKIIQGKIIFQELHFERFRVSLDTLKIEMPPHVTFERLKKEIIALCDKNRYSEKARVRLSVSRGNGGLYDSDNNFQYIIECWPLNETTGRVNENGLAIDIFPDAKKSIDKFSNLKSANYLPYVMAALFAKENKLNDALVLNSSGRICDATIANVFWIKDKIIYTPPLSEGCVAGVMRRWVLDCRLQITDLGFDIRESVVTEDELSEADEVFLTNTISGIRWAGQFRNKKYKNRFTQKIYDTCIKQLIG